MYPANLRAELGEMIRGSQKDTHMRSLLWSVTDTEEEERDWERKWCSTAQRSSLEVRKL